MPSDSLGTLIHRLSGVYRDPQRVLRDAETLLSSPLGSHLRPTTEPLTLNDGSSTPPVLLLRGTIPMTYRGVTYNLPVDVYLPPPYPLRPPTCFVRPVASMAIKENHKHVGLDGKVYLPYLHSWRPQTHDLRELAVWMSSLFGSEPPCYSKPAGAAAGAVGNGGRNGRSNPPSYKAVSAGASSHAGPNAGSAYSSSYASSAYGSANSSAADEAKRKALEEEIAAANQAAETARRAEVEEKRVEAERRRLQREHGEDLARTRAIATSRAQAETRRLFGSMKEEMRTELRNQKQLEHGKCEIQRALREGRERKEELERANREMDEAVEALAGWLERAKEIQRAEGDGDGGRDDGEGLTGADLAALPADTRSAQMLALSAENAAIDDCVYHLDRALVRGGMTLETYMKEVRRLSKRQFMAKAHLIKIAQTRAAGRG